MPNAKSHNAFYYFMLDFKDRQGKKFKSMKEVAEAAGAPWRNLTATQRRPYELKAQAVKGNKAKFNSDRQAIDEIEEKERKEQEWILNMQDDIQARMSIAKKTKTLHTDLFFIIHMNSFCQHEQTKEYSPCEVAIAGFSLTDGVLGHNIYHSEIKAGPLPVGYAHMASQHAKDTHMMDLPNVGNQAEDNQEKVLDEILEFLSNKKRSGSTKFPTLYAAQKDIPMVKAVLEGWCAKFGHLGARIEDFQFYNLQYMFTSLRNAVAKSDVWTSHTMSYIEIERDVYNYTLDIACKFHQAIDSLVFCSRSIVVRYVYIICDNCCKDANIELIPGCHVPSNAKTSSDDTEFVKPSKRRTNKAYPDSSVREDTTDVQSVSLSNGPSEWNDSSSSINFPELSCGKRFETRSVATATSYSSATANHSSFNMSEGLSGMITSEKMMDRCFPPLNARPQGLRRGLGRGRPFRNLPSNDE